LGHYFLDKEIKKIRATPLKE